MNFAELRFWEYADFMANRVFGGHFDSLRHLAIPVGISFYTFQKVAFVVDTCASIENEIDNAQPAAYCKPEPTFPL